MKIVSTGFIVALFASSLALAGHHEPTPKDDPSSLSASLSIAAAASHSSSKSQSAAHSLSNATGGKSSAVAGGGAGGEGGSSSAIVDTSPVATSTSEGGEGGASSSANDLTIEGDEAARIPVATALVGSTNTTAPCRYSAGGAGQAPVIGLSIVFAKKDKDCERLIVAQDLYGRGQKTAGDKVYCLISTVREALGDDCLSLINELTVVRTDRRLEKKSEFDRVSK